MATRRSWDHMSGWAGQPVPTPGSPWPGRPLGGGFAMPLMQAQGGIFRGTVKASQLATLSQPCPHHRQRTQGVGAGTEVASCPGPTFPLDPNGGISQALPWGARASPSCPAASGVHLPPPVGPSVAPKLAPASAASAAPALLQAPNTLSCQAQWKPVPAMHTGWEHGDRMGRIRKHRTCQALTVCQCCPAPVTRRGHPITMTVNILSLPS